MKALSGIALCCGVVLGACSPAQDQPANDSSVALATTAKSGAVAAGFDPATRTATVLATDFAFDAPDTITAGWTTIRLRNDGTMLHHMQLVRLDSGRTPADLEAAMKYPGPPPAWITAVGGPNAPDPGAESSSTVQLTPGQYVMLCFVDIPDHVPHFAKGMVRPFVVVEGSGDQGTEPTADVTITMADYSYAIDGDLTAGTHTIRVLNDGPQEHELAISRLAPGKTLADFETWEADMSSPPPFSALGGIVDLHPGATPAYFTVDLTPGNYALLCFIPDATDGKPHLAHGMIQEFTVR
jgi:uncharacterized cupredoxin-like copper-binding protein